MNQEEYLNKAANIYKLIGKIHDKKVSIWLENVIFTWQWWLGVFLAIVPWILWILFRKKDSTYRLLTSGLFCISITSWFDFIGISLGKWHYNYDVLPLLPSYLPWDFTLIPIFIMSLIQFKPQSNPFIKALIFAAVSAFIGEPFFIWIKTYSPDHWKSIYSFPIFLCIYLLAHFISTRGEFVSLNKKLH